MSQTRGTGSQRLQLQTSHAMMLTKLDLPGDRKRRVNLKISEVPDDISPAELPHHLRHLLTIILPHAQAKKLMYDACTDAIYSHPRCDQFRVIPYHVLPGLNQKHAAMEKVLRPDHQSTAYSWSTYLGL
ncbi:Hypothetical predicted protein [Pelobates cultripes]|uniref:Uncharacterized protein n=1 Tax=Pelobates cultripes TaxID=61616 RepID=A0AAD1SG00_PELCU|nr:Hypothetical predicted protein [Pelobates cultripes]